MLLNGNIFYTVLINDNICTPYSVLLNGNICALCYETVTFVHCITKWLHLVTQCGVHCYLLVTLFLHHGTKLLHVYAV